MCTTAGQDIFYRREDFFIARLAKNYQSFLSKCFDTMYSSIKLDIKRILIVDIFSAWLPVVLGWISFANNFVKEWWGLMSIIIFIWISGELNWIREFIRRTSIGQKDIISELSQMKIELSSLRKRVAPTDKETLDKFNLFD